MYSRPGKFDTQGYAKAVQAAGGNGTLKSLFVRNKGASAVEIHLFDKATAGSEGAVPGWTSIPLAAGQYYESDTRREFIAGLYICASSTDETKTLIGSNDVWITGEYVY